MQYPIVYSKHYNISLMGLENVHPFDTKKYGKIWNTLKGHLNIDERHIYSPHPASRKALLEIHTEHYLDALATQKSEVEMILGISLPDSIQMTLLQKFLLNPIRHAVQGTVMAAELALKQGWSINLSGGYHHAHAEHGGGFCFFNDHFLAARNLWKTNPGLTILYVDLDAHLGDGTLSFAMNEERFHILDLYNTFEETKRPYIEKSAMKKRIRTIGIPPWTGDDHYLPILRELLPQSIARAKPDIIFYNAGSDILEGDNLGCLKVSAEGIAARDQLVFGQAMEHNIPLMMVLSGGYGKENHRVVSSSILSLLDKMASF